MTELTNPIIYNLFPRLVGSVARWAEHLERIAAMGFTWVWVNPFQYAGFSGSLYATKDHYRLNPLFEDGTGQSAGRLIGEFVFQAERVGLAVMMDLVINHTARDSLLAETHPEWFRRDESGALLSPSAIDPADSRKVTVWGDLAELDYNDRLLRAELTEYFEAVGTYYAGLGVAGFRCDAAYKVPAEVWSGIIQAVRRVRPRTLFAAETLGCRLDEIERLRPAGFDYRFNSSKWWNFKDAWLVEQYETFRSFGPSISFPESHDTGRLADEAPPGGDPAVLARQRYAFAALFASGVLMPLGYEYGFRRKLDVVATRPADWETPAFDLSGFVAGWNRLRSSWRGFWVDGPQRSLAFPQSEVVGLLRHGEPGTMAADEWSLSLINPDLTQAHAVDLVGIPELDAVGGVEVTPERPHEAIPAGAALILKPGEVRVLLSRAAEVRGGRP